MFFAIVDCAIFARSFECSQKLSPCLWPVTLVVPWYLQTLFRFTDSCIQAFFHVVPRLVRNYIVGIIAFLKTSVRNAQSRCPENKYSGQKPPTYPPPLLHWKSQHLQREPNTNYNPCDRVFFSHLVGI